MGYTVIAPMGDNPKALFVGMKEFATERVYLISPKAYLKQAKKIEKQLKPFSIPVHIVETTQELMESMFLHFGKICAKYDPDDIIVNVATGDKLSTCAALSAAFANGLKAFGIMHNKPMLLPIMHLSYYNELTENKLTVLRHLHKEEFVTLTQLKHTTGLSLSLLSYHLNGTLKYKGLRNLRLVETKEKNKQVLVRLSQLGALLLKGYISCTKK